MAGCALTTAVGAFTGFVVTEDVLVLTAAGGMGWVTSGPLNGFLGAPDTCGGAGRFPVDSAGTVI